jgi:Na+-transporting NADH:ubiquinone oxidoreductase subunit C
MAVRHILNLWRDFLARPNESQFKTIGVAFLVALSCGLTVSLAAVALRPVQQANIEAERQGSMRSMLASLPGLAEILSDAGADAVETRVVELDSGRIETEIDPADFDQDAAAADPFASRELARREDLAGIGRRENSALVHFVHRDGELALVVLPLRGSGYQSTIRAYLALESDLDTVAAFTVYEHRETPGVGARIADAPWQAQWRGKRVYDESGEPVIEVVDAGAAGPHQVDGISGATVSGYAVSDMIRFWTGPRGYGPLLGALREGWIE